MKLKAQ